VLSSSEAIDVAVPSYDALPAMIKSGTLQTVRLQPLAQLQTTSINIAQHSTFLDPATTTPRRTCSQWVWRSTHRRRCCICDRYRIKSLLFDAEPELTPASCGMSVLDGRTRP
jgi:hypothetical protein